MRLQRLAPWIVALMMPIWPLAVWAAAQHWPGPETHPEVRDLFSQSPYVQNRPATVEAPAGVDAELSGAGELVSTGGGGAARIFWAEPEPGRVQIEVQIPAQQ